MKLDGIKVCHCHQDIDSGGPHKKIKNNICLWERRKIHRKKEEKSENKLDKWRMTSTKKCRHPFQLKSLICWEIEQIWESLLVEISKTNRYRDPLLQIVGVHIQLFDLFNCYCIPWVWAGREFYMGIIKVEKFDGWQDSTCDNCDM